jgi:bla regulator protein blaR1
MNRIAAAVAVVIALASSAIDAQVRGAGPIGTPIDPETRFEVVSIKPFDPSATLRLSMTPTRYDMAGMPLRALVAQALVTPPNRIIGLPDWVDKERYAIAAKAPDGTSSNAMFTMITNLLKDRFNLAMHRETREMPVYHLVFARADKRFGPALTETSAECKTLIVARLEAAQHGGAPPADPNGCVSLRINPGIVSIRGAQPAMIAGSLPAFVGRPVFDKTGLTGYFDYTLKWTPVAGSDNPLLFGLPPGGLPDATPPADPDAPNIFTAVQEQLGLKLESSRGPVDVIVIDRIEKPALD